MKNERGAGDSFWRWAGNSAREEEGGGKGGEKGVRREGRM